MLLSCLCHPRLDVSITGSDTQLPGSSLPAPFLPHFPVAHNLTSWTPLASYPAPCSLATRRSRIQKHCLPSAVWVPSSAVHEPVRSWLPVPPRSLHVCFSPPLLAQWPVRCSQPASSLKPPSCLLPGRCLNNLPHRLLSFHPLLKNPLR